jgi:putative chitinase
MNTKLLSIVFALVLFGSTLATFPVARGLAAPQEQGQTIIYVVRYGDTLSALAVRYQTTVSEIVRINGLTNPNLIYVGQVLRIPVGSTQQPFIYIVRRGDTLSGIAARFGTTVAALVRANGIRNPNLIYVGQRLVIPTGGGTPPPPPPPPPITPGPTCVHVVQRGESLSSIGRIYGVNPYEIARVNNIRPPYIIYAGQRLFIPTSNCVTTPVPATATATTVPGTSPTATTPSYPPPPGETETPVPTATTVPPTETPVASPTATTPSYPPPPAETATPVPTSYP